MRAAVYRGRNRVTIGEWPVPAIGMGELLLRLRGCGLCGSDIAKIAGDHPAPAVFGHEVVGDILRVGPEVERFAEGDRVVVAHHVPCFACHYCRRGSPSMCRAFKETALDPGGFAEVIRVPAANVRHATFRIPGHVSDESASFIEPLGCCLRAVRRARVAPEDVALVVGLGSIGCLFAQLLRRAGVHVVGADPIAERVKLARRLGVEAEHAPQAAEQRVRDRSDGRGADLVVVTGGGGAALPTAVALVRDGGAIHYFAGAADDRLSLSLATLYHRELTLTATYSSSPADLQRAYDLVAAGELALEPLMSHRLPLSEVDRGVALMLSREAMKVFVVPDDSA
jgi:L-iditol 2-dehydrogenase